MWIYRPIIAANKFRNADRTGKTFFRPDRFSDKSGTAQRIGGTNHFPPNLRTSHPRFRLPAVRKIAPHGSPPSPKGSSTDAPAPERAPQADCPPGCASALKNFYSVRRVFSGRTVSPSGSGSTPRISETVCPRRAFEPAGTDWLKTVPAPENETIIPCRSSR